MNRFLVLPGSAIYSVQAGTLFGNEWWLRSNM